MLLASFKGKFEELQSKYNQFLKADSENSLGGEQNGIECKIAEKENTIVQPLVIKPKPKNKKRILLKKLMFCTLKPSLRLLLLKQKKIALEDFLSGDSDGETIEEKTGIKCPLCSNTLQDSVLLEQHLALSHAKEVTYKCNNCTFICQFHGDYLNHMKTHFPGPPYKCDTCDTSFDQITKLISHRTKHSEETSYQCTLCSYKSKIKQNYINHLKTHTPEKNYKCDICSKAFKFKHSLDSHLHVHFSDKSLTCDSCGFSTKFLSHLIAHKRIHTADVYRCSYPLCKFSSSKKNQLLTHSKTHNGIRPHSCNICGRGFMEKSHLVRHERIHLEEKPFKCSNCDYASSRRDKLKEHFTRHHGENASAKVPYKARPMRNNNTCASSKSKQPAASESVTTTNAPSLNFTPTTTTLVPNINQPIGSDLQELIMQHQNHPVTSANTNSTSTLNTNYPHFSDPTDFHHHTHTHNIQHQILSSSHNQRTVQHQNNPVNHHMLPRPNHPTATSTAAAVAAAMMLDPRFHHNSAVPYPATTPASMAMAAAVQTTQQIQASGQHTEYAPSIQNCMALF